MYYCEIGVFFPISRQQILKSQKSSKVNLKKTSNQCVIITFFQIIDQNKKARLIQNQYFHERIPDNFVNPASKQTSFRKQCAALKLTQPQTVKINPSRCFN